ncbi:MAG: ABC transporter ATP-binding protein [Desulfamplus sp.]|nr:ABC transporter ATP-binding protein [Desulfamplus sp.]
MIKVENLNKIYKSVHALKDINLHVKKGELFAYLGPNGAGKSTTIRILTALTNPTSGTVSINGFDIKNSGFAFFKSNSIKSRQQCGLVPQSINLDQELSVYENLTIHGLLFRMGKSERNKKIEELLSYVDLSSRKESLVKELSGGMKRRLMIARALMHSPSVLFLDEPTVGLDAGMRRKIWGLIKKIQQQGTTIFLTTHYIEEAEFLADRVAFLDTGTILVVDTPSNLMSRLGTWALDRLIEDKMEPIYFSNREEANSYIASQNESFTLRRVNLEDAFLSMTGKKVK